MRARRDFWLSGVGIWGNLRADDAAVSEQTEIVVRILTVVLVAEVLGKCTGHVL